MSKDCPLCDYTSNTAVGVKQHLSQSHKDKNNPYKSKTICKHCGDVWWMLDSYIDMGKGSFCSDKCEMEFGNVHCICKNCNESFTIHRNEYDRRKSNGKFCKRACESDYKSVDKNCEVCGNDIHVKRARIEGDGGKYCKPECYYIDERSDTAEIRNTQEYKDWKNRIKERDGCCVRCGNDENLHAHHIVPITEDETLATDMENGKTLCDSCHAEEHPEIANLINHRNV